jgi:hypothetical protein
MKVASLNISKFHPILTHFELPQVFAPLHREIIWKSAANFSTDLAGGTHATRVNSFRRCSDPQQNRQAHTLTTQQSRKCLCAYVSNCKTLISTLWTLFLARETSNPALQCIASLRRECPSLIPISFNFSAVRTRSFHLVPSLSNYDPLCLNLFPITWLDFVSDTVNTLKFMPECFPSFP